MALLSLQDASAGVAVTLTAANAGGDQIPAGSRAAAWDLGVILLARNGGASPVDVTVQGHPQVTVPAGATGVIPVYGVAFGALRDVTYSAVTSVTVAAVRLAGD